MSYHFHLAADRHLEFLPAIEDAAGMLFPEEDLPGELRSIAVSPEQFAAACSQDLLWVATTEADSPVGFLLGAVLDGGLHIAEFAVHPTHGRAGVGTGLLGHVLQTGRQRGFEFATLTTFGHLRWNAPFYVKQGFEVLDVPAARQGLAQIIERERRLGMRRRVAMMKWL